MARLKKNISFSEHERDIYDFLSKQKNASAYIKNLVRYQMFLEEHNMEVVTTVKDNNETTSEQQSKEQSEEPEEIETEPEENEPEETSDEKVEDTIEKNEPEEIETEPQETSDEEDLTVEVDLTEEDLKNKVLLPEL